MCFHFFPCEIPITNTTKIQYTVKSAQIQGGYTEQGILLPDCTFSAPVNVLTWTELRSGQPMSQQITGAFQ
jgi:hypothetical protein